MAGVFRGCAHKAAIEAIPIIWAMRSWVIIAMMVLLPLQLTWAATAAYCAHESGQRASHVGHHEHPHAKADERAGATDIGKLSAAKGDLDCGTCHMGCLALLGKTDQVAAPAAALMPGGDTLAHASAPDTRPDRPQWPALV